MGNSKFMNCLKTFNFCAVCHSCSFPLLFFLTALGQWSPIPCTYAGGGKGKKFEPFWRDSYWQGRCLKKAWLKVCSKPWSFSHWKKSVILKEIKVYGERMGENTFFQWLPWLVVVLNFYSKIYWNKEKVLLFVYRYWRSFALHLQQKFKYVYSVLSTLKPL